MRAVSALHESAWIKAQALSGRSAAERRRGQEAEEHERWDLLALDSRRCTRELKGPHWHGLTGTRWCPALTCSHLACASAALPTHPAGQRGASPAGAAKKRLPSLPEWVDRDNIGQAAVIGTEEDTAQVRGKRVESGGLAEARQLVVFSPPQHAP